MIKRNRVVKALYIFVGFGLLYAFTLGIHTSEIKSGILNDRVELRKTLVNHVSFGKETINLCLHGFTDNDSMVRNYSISIPLETFVDKKSENYIKKEILYVPNLNVPIALMKSECSVRGEVIVTHEFDDLNLDYDGQINYLKTNTKWSKTSKLYTFKDSQSEKKSLYIYLNLAEVNDYFSINFRGEKRGISSKLVFDAIVAVAKDIVTFPYQLILWFDYLGSH